MSVSRCDRVTGILIGLAVGDKNHGPIHMALDVAESLLDKKKFDGEDLFARFISWYKDKGIGSDDTGLVGLKVFDEAIRDPKKHYGVIVDEVDEFLEGMTAGVNGTHRSVAIAMYRDISDEDLESVCHKQVLLTHKSKYGQDVCYIVNYLLRAIIYEEELEGAVKTLLKRKWDDMTIRALNSFMIDDRNESYLSRGGFSPDVLSTTLYFVRKYTRNVDYRKMEPHQASKIFTDCLDDSFKLAGQANFCPVLVGAFMGAICGSINIDKIQYQHCKSPDRVLKVSSLLSQSWK